MSTCAKKIYDDLCLLLLFSVRYIRFSNSMKMDESKQTMHRHSSHVLESFDDTMRILSVSILVVDSKREISPRRISSTNARNMIITLEFARENMPSTIVNIHDIFAGHTGDMHSWNVHRIIVLVVRFVSCAKNRQSICLASIDVNINSFVVFSTNRSSIFDAYEQCCRNVRLKNIERQVTNFIRILPVRC
jgi:hypothetical protein